MTEAVAGQRVREAAQLLPARRAGKKPRVQTLYAWTTDGCRGVILESVQVDATRCTSKEAMARFIAALTAQTGLSEQAANVPQGVAHE